MANRPYDLTAELMEPTQANFISRDDFTRFLAQNGEAAVRVAQQLSENYHAACQEIRRSRGFPDSFQSRSCLRLLLLNGQPENGWHMMPICQENA